MNGTKTFAMLIALAAAASAPVAVLAQDNHGYGNNGGYNNGGYNNGGYNNGRYNNGNNGGNRSDQGVIASVNGSNLRLQDGRTIFLHNGTVINPRGTTLQAGQRISVSGSRGGGQGAINADEIDVNGNGNGNGYGNRRHHHHHDDNDNNGNYGRNY